MYWFKDDKMVKFMTFVWKNVEKRVWFAVERGKIALDFSDLNMLNSLETVNLSAVDLMNQAYVANVYNLPALFQ